MQDAGTALKGFIQSPEMQHAVEKLSKLKKKFDEEIPYYKHFKIFKGEPSILPITVIQEFTDMMKKLRQEALMFKKTFNENELPEHVGGIFLNMFLILTKDSLEVKESKVLLGGKPIAWIKTADWVLGMFSKLPYKVKVEYSKESYNHIVQYFTLLNIVQTLEKELL